jgi:hypothetical protein
VQGDFTLLSQQHERPPDLTPAKRIATSGITFDNEQAVRRDDSLCIKRTAHGYELDVNIVDPDYCKSGPAENGLRIGERQEAITFRFSFTQSFELKDVKFFLSVDEPRDNYTFADGNRILNTPSHEHFDEIKLLERAAKALHANNQYFHPMEALTGLRGDSGRRRYELPAERDDGHKMGAIVEACMCAVNRAAANLVMKFPVAALFQVRGPKDGSLGALLEFTGDKQAQPAAIDPREGMEVWRLSPHAITGF